MPTTREIIFQAIRLEIPRLSQKQVDTINKLLDGWNNQPFVVERKRFFGSLRKSVGPLSPQLVDGCSKILNEWELRRLSDPRWLANMMAQSYWETGRTMQPVREFGSEEYLRKKKYYPWVGEGLIQVTWEENHRKFGAEKPGDLMSWPKALVVLFDRLLGEFYDPRHFPRQDLTNYISCPHRPGFRVWSLGPLP